MSYIDDGGFFSPICEHFIDLETIRTAQWVQCPCGNWFNYSLLVDLESAKNRLEVAQDDVRFLQAEVARVSAKGEAAGVKRFIKAVATTFRSAEGGAAVAPSAPSSAPASTATNNQPTIRTIAPAVPQAAYSAASTSTTAASTTTASAASRPAYVPPTPKVPERPRGIAASENRKQIGLFIISVVMVMAAYLSYIGWGVANKISADIQVPVSAVVIIGLGVVAVRAKRLSRVLANVLASTSSVLALIALFALADNNVYGTQKAWVAADSWHNYPYMALIPIILAILTIVPGYLFKVAAWLNPTAVLFAAGGVIFNLTYQQTVLVGSNPSLSLGWQLLTPSLTMVLVVVAGAASRLKLDELPDEAGVKKLIGAPEADRRAYYELVQAHKERTNLNRANRASLIGLLGVMAAHVLTNLMNFIGGRAFDGTGLLVLGVVWIGLSIGIETVGTRFTQREEVPMAIRRGAWLTGLSSLGLGVVTTSLGAAGQFSASNVGIAILVWAIGTALLFATRVLPWVRQNTAFAFAANISAFFIWLVWFGYALYNGGFNEASDFAIGSIYAGLIAATLLVHNFMFKTTSLQIPAALLVATSALLSFGGARTEGGLATITGAAVAITIGLFIVNGFTIANAFINDRANQGDNPVVRSIGIAANVAAVLIALPGALTQINDSAGKSIDATLYWPMLLVLVLFAGALLVVPNLGFATKNDSVLTLKTGVTLTGQAALYLGIGFVYSIAVSQHEHIFVTVTAYTFAVMLVILTYGYLRRAVWAITSSYALSTIFSIALGEAMMNFENTGLKTADYVHAIWFLVPFAVLTYLHLLIMRVRAEASVRFKVGVGVGGFGLTALAYEITRGVVQNHGYDAQAIAAFTSNRNLNVATLLALAALVLLLRTIKAVRADESRNHVLNVTGLITLALASFDAVTSVADGYNLPLLQLVLVASTVLLLINGRTSMPKTHAVASFFAGNVVIVTAWTTIDWLTRGLPDITRNSDSAAPNLFTPFDGSDVYASYAAFFAMLGWFAVINRSSIGKAMGVNLKTAVLLVATVFNAINVFLLGFPAENIVGTYYSSDARMAAWPLSHLMLAGATLAALFVWRWIARKSELHVAVLTSGLIVWIVGTSNGTSRFSDYWFWAIILAVPAVLLLADGLIKKSKISAYVAAAPLFASVWSLASAIGQNNDSGIAIWHLAFGLVAFAAVTALLGKLKAISTAWIFTLPATVLVSSIATTSLVSWHNVKVDVNWLTYLAATLLALGASVWIGDKLTKGGYLAVLSAAAVTAFTGFNLIVSAFNFSNALGSEQATLLVYLAVLAVGLFWQTLASKLNFMLLVSTAVSLLASFVFGATVSSVWHWFTGPEGASVTAAGTLVFAAFAYRRIGGTFKGTLVSWGAPTAMLLLPSVFYTFITNEISQPWNSMASEGIVRLVGLAVVGTVVMLTGMRAGNKGLVYASVATVMLEFVPALWFGIENLFRDYGQATVGELRGLLIAITVFVLQTILKRAVHIRINSIVIWGIPAVVSLAPMLIDVWGALGHGAQSSDWVRFAVLVSVSTGFLSIGAIRRISGLFYPGFFGVLTAVLPYAFTEGGGLGIVFTLIALAGLIIWVAMRIENFTGWLKELK